MKRAVRGRLRVSPLRPDRTLERIREDAKLDQVMWRRVLDNQPRGTALERQPHVDDLVPLNGVRACDTEAVVRPVLNEPVRTHLVEDSPDLELRRAVSVLEVDELQPPAGLVRAELDVVADPGEEPGVALRRAAGLHRYLARQA